MTGAGPALSGWRREMFGSDALALKHGRLALTAGRNRIELVAAGRQRARLRLG